MRPLVLCLVATTLACGSVVGTPADAGLNLLDPGFGTDGMTRTRFGCTTSARANALVAGADGRVIAAGKGCNGWALAGYLDNGAPDPAFGDGGWVVHFAGAGEAAELRTLIARPDGRLIARAAGGSRDVVRQFTATGALDTDFASAVDLALANDPSSVVQAMALQADGKLLVANGAVLTRVLTDGTLDTTFGNGGRVNVSLFGAATFQLEMRIHPDGRIVLLGLALEGMNRHGAPFVAQLLATGEPDLTFGTKGIVELRPPLGGYNEVKAAALQADGKVLVAGSVKASELARSHPAVWRLTATGVLDLTFGARGEAQAPPGGGDTELQAVSVLADGKIVAVGSYRHTKLFAESWQVVRFTHAGELDASFGKTGSTVFDLGLTYSPGGAEALAVTPAGYVVAGRFFNRDLPTELVLARILP